MESKKHMILIPNRSLGDFILGSNIKMYLQRDHTKKIYRDPTSTDISYYFKEDDVNVWCDRNGIVNTIRCTSSCFYKEMNLIGMKFDDFLEIFPNKPDYEDIVYMLVNDKGQRQHVYDFFNDGLQVWTWRKRIRTILVYKDE